MEEPCEDGFAGLEQGPGQGLAFKQITAVVVGDGQRITIETVTGSELTFEVRTPAVVGEKDLSARFTGMADGPSPWSLGDEAIAREDVGDG